jgi:hypothetical protein
MKKPSIFDFYTWNPLKKGIYISLTFNFRNKVGNEYSEAYILISFIFIQLVIDFKNICYRFKNTKNEKNNS